MTRQKFINALDRLSKYSIAYTKCLIGMKHSRYEFAAKIAKEKEILIKDYEKLLERVAELEERHDEYLLTKPNKDVKE